MGKSLSEKISAIANKPVVADYDIENAETNSFEHREGSDDELDSSEDERQASSHYVSVGKSKLKDKGIHLRDEKYKGAKSSRKALYDGDDDSESGENSETDNNLDRVSEDVDGVDSDSVDDDSVEVESVVESVSESDASEEFEDPESDQEEEDTEYKRKRLAALVQQETQTAVKRLSETSRQNASKGYAILEQNRLFDQILDTRIKLQKAVTAANELPLSKDSWELHLRESKGNKRLLKEAIGKLKDVMGQLIDFRDEFQMRDNINQNPDSFLDHSAKKRSYSELCEQTDTLDAQLKVYRSAVLQKWSHKILSASGKSALASSKFKAINQTADVQVKNQLADLPRLLKRTTLNRRNVVPLSFEADLNAGLLDKLKNTTNSMDAESDDLDIPKNYDPRRKDNTTIDTNENPYVFDDEDFYRILLNDLVDKKISNAQTESSGVTIALTSRSSNKLKKNVDTKASKGRKINYKIQEPIANYEAPVNGGFKWSDEQIDEFFAGLLGQKVSFSEIDERLEHNSSEDDDIKNDGIQIFG
ncbi:LAMI_0D04368g1_1 [Lachancea mirantina]|uniref:Protein BFR2 n=1 Tax=Lachancea mirantina TaxID=1230905 RepID=A0A1G4JB27_9SACH|nr:LAMI_0D04368g1_1 [Lachancea mirantina]